MRLVTSPHLLIGLGVSAMLRTRSLGRFAHCHSSEHFPFCNLSLLAIHDIITSLRGVHVDAGFQLARTVDTK